MEGACVLLFSHHLGGRAGKKSLLVESEGEVEEGEGGPACTVVFIRGTAGKQAHKAAGYCVGGSARIPSSPTTLIPRPEVRIKHPPTRHRPPKILVLKCKVNLSVN